LTIRAIRSAPVRTFLPADSKPLKVFEDVIDGSLGRPFHIRIFDPQDEGSSSAFCKEIVEKSGSGIPDMEKPCGGRSKAHTNREGHLKPFYTFRVALTQAFLLISSKIKIPISKKIPMT
jgi:hypothetical protein